MWDGIIFTLGAWSCRALAGRPSPLAQPGNLHSRHCEAANNGSLCFFLKLCYVLLGSSRDGPCAVPGPGPGSGPGTGPGRAMPAATRRPRTWLNSAIVATLPAPPLRPPDKGPLPLGPARTRRPSPEMLGARCRSAMRMRSPALEPYGLAQPGGLV